MRRGRGEKRRAVWKGSEGKWEGKKGNEGELGKLGKGILTETK